MTSMLSAHLLNGRPQVLKVDDIRVGVHQHFRARILRRAAIVTKVSMDCAQANQAGRMQRAKPCHAATGNQQKLGSTIRGNFPDSCLPE